MNNGKDYFKVVVVRLEDYKLEIGEKETQKLLSNFFCSINPDIQYFIREKAIPFEDSNKARTYLILGFEGTGNHFIIAYYSLSQKSFLFEGVSNNAKKKLVGHEEFKRKDHSAILIGQIGRNDNAPYRIEGAQIFKNIFETIYESNRIIAGAKFIYLDAVNDPKLIKKYMEYGFEVLKLNDGSYDLSDNNENLVKMIMPMSKLKNIILK